MRKWSLALGWVLLAVSCDPVDVAKVDQPGADYLPWKVGNYFIYQVDSVSTTLNVSTPFRFKLKIAVTDSFKITAGGTTYILSRARQWEGAETWTPMPTWQARNSDREGVVVEGNTPFLKLVFPILENASWNGNAFNTLAGNDACGDGQAFTCDEYTVRKLPAGFSAGGQTYPESIEVIQEDAPDLLTIHDVRSETYARGIGLVDRSVEFKQYCSKNDCLGKGFIDRGWNYHWVLIEHGAE